MTDRKIKKAALCIAIRAIKGMDINELAEDEKEGAASAIDQGYVYHEGDMLYTKILVSDGMSRDELFRISREIRNDPSFILEADRIAEPPLFPVSDTHFAATWLLDTRAPKIDPPESIALRSRIFREKQSERSASL